MQWKKKKYLTSLPPGTFLKRCGSLKTSSLGTTNSKSLFCSCDGVKAQEDLLTLQSDTKVALEKAWKQAGSLEQEVTAKGAIIDELLWQINFCNERKMQALQFLKYLEDEMGNALIHSAVLRKIQKADFTKRPKLIEFSGRAMRKLFSYTTRFKSNHRNDRLYADQKLMVTSRDLTIDAMEQFLINTAKVSIQNIEAGSMQIRS